MVRARCSGRASPALRVLSPTPRALRTGATARLRSVSSLPWFCSPRCWPSAAPTRRSRRRSRRMRARRSRPTSCARTSWSSRCVAGPPLPPPTERAQRAHFRRMWAHRPVGPLRAQLWDGSPVSVGRSWTLTYTVVNVGQGCVAWRASPSAASHRCGSVLRATPSAPSRQCRARRGDPGLLRRGGVRHHRGQRHHRRRQAGCVRAPRRESCRALARLLLTRTSPMIDAHAAAPRRSSTSPWCPRSRASTRRSAAQCRTSSRTRSRRTAWPRWCVPRPHALRPVGRSPPSSRRPCDRARAV